jgi:hypothetical protein
MPTFAKLQAMLQAARSAASCSLLLAAMVVTGLSAQAQVSTLPPTPPTSLPTANTLPAPLAATPLGSGSTRPRKPLVTFGDGQLEVRAYDSSLNEILHLIAKQTGMTISGGVADQRVFGNYGPASPSEVLATLLDGTGTNMLVRENSTTDAPLELVLTPRGGGPTPPSPDNQTYDDAPEGPPNRGPIRGRGNLPAPGFQRPSPTNTSLPVMPQPLNNPLGDPSNTTPTASQIPVTNSVPTDTLPAPSTAQEPPQGIVDSPNPPPPGSTTSTSPNGVKTPEQIYQQLLQMQKQQNNGTTTPNPPTNTTPQ